MSAGSVVIAVSPFESPATHSDVVGQDSAVMSLFGSIGCGELNAGFASSGSEVTSTLPLSSPTTHSAVEGHATADGALDVSMGSGSDVTVGVAAVRSVNTVT